MKFLETHRIDIIDSFEELNYTKADFHFIKRKGRIITQYATTRSEFSYFLKKDITLDPASGTFVEIQQYEIKENDGERYFVEQWSRVLYHLKKWLKTLRKVG